MHGGIAFCQSTTQGFARRITACFSNGEIFGINQPFPCFAILCFSRNFGTVGDFQAGGAGFDKAAVALQRGFCLDAAAEVQFAVVEVAEQFHFAVTLAHGVGFNVAAVADDGFFHRVGTQCGEDDVAAVGKDGAAVIDQPLQGAAFQCVGEVVAG